MRDGGDAQGHGSLRQRVLETKPQTGDSFCGPCTLAQHVAKRVGRVGRPQDGGGVQALEFEEGVRVKGKALGAV